MKVLVSGGAGFIGSHLAEALVRRGARVRILDNFSTGKRENLGPVRGKVEICRGDLRDPAEVSRAVKGAVVVFHQGALPSVTRSIEDPVTTNAVNAGGTLNVLEAARRHGVRRVVCASSSSVYGETPALPKVETMPPSPLSPYALSKLVGEEYARLFSRLYGFSTVSLRYFNVFGPRQDPDSPYAAVIPKFVAAMSSNRRPVIFGDGRQTRDFTFVADVVQANLKAARARGLKGQAVNIACGRRISILTLARRLAELLGKDLRPQHSLPRPGDIKHSLADISLARRLLGYRPASTLEMGLRATVDWFRPRHIR